MFRAVPLLAVMLLAPSLAFATTYYVDPAGSDAHDGSEASPWKTLQQAAGAVSAGDTVIVHAGSYAGFSVGFSTDVVAGTASAPVRFLADANVIINDRNDDTADGIDLEPGCDYWDIEGFTVQNPGGTISRAGIRVTDSEGVVVRNNVVDGCGTWGIFTSHANGILIEHNRSSHAGTQHGIYVSNASVNPVVRGNTLFSNHANGLHMNGDASQGGNGVITGALVEDNVIYDNGEGGGSGINCDGVQDSTLRNNLLYGNHASGISLYQTDAAEPATGNVVVNNTIVEAADARWAINIQDASTGNTVLNNILFDENPSHGAVNISADSLPGFVSDYNLVADAFAVGDNGNVDLAAWQSQTGQDAHSLVSTEAANFVAPGSDFHLLANAPAVNAGTATNAPSSDLDGNARPSGSSVDIGAYEYGASPGTSSSSSSSGSSGTSTSGSSGTSTSGSSGTSTSGSSGTSTSGSAASSSTGGSGGTNPTTEGCGCGPSGSFDLLGALALLFVGAVSRPRRPIGS